MAAVGQMFAQNQSSPYSRYGYGLFSDYATSAQRNMGGVGVAMADGRQINVMNPASYAATDRDAYSETVLIHSNVDNGWGIVGALATERHTIRF